MTFSYALKFDFKEARVARYIPPPTLDTFSVEIFRDAHAASGAEIHSIDAAIIDLMIFLVNYFPKQYFLKL